MENACACLNIIKIEVNFRSLFFHDSIIKTFLNHSILLSKLQIYGYLSSTIQWFTSYLSDRSLNVLTLRVHYLTLCLYLSVIRKEAFLVLFSFYYS